MTVLRDTGCSDIVVQREMVNNESLADGKHVCILADGTIVEAPIAKIAIDTPYLQRKFEGWCMVNPVYDLIIGNAAEQENLILQNNQYALLRQENKLRTKVSRMFN